MGDLRDEVDDLLEAGRVHPEELRELVETDESTETWAFDDVPLDSGAFGEIVSRGIVDKRGGEYALADRAAVVAALDGESTAERRNATDEDDGSVVADIRKSVLAIDVSSVWSLAATLGLVALFRLVPYPQVFRSETIVLSSNGPYYYRFLVEAAVRRTSGAYDFSILSELPADAAAGEPLFVATLWFLSELVGGTTRTTGTVMAWYPVVAGLLSAVFVYMIADRVTDDRRVAIAAVALLAIVPSHAFRTGLGFADHHAFDYFWLSLTALGLVTLTDSSVRDWTTWAWTGLFATGLAGQILAWEAGPLMIAPVSVYVIGRTVVDVRAERWCFGSMASILTGFAAAGAALALAHSALGWHTKSVVYGTILLFAVSIGAVATTELSTRFGGSPLQVTGLVAAGVVVSSLALTILVPDVATALDRGVAYFIRTEGIAETRSLFADDLGSIIAPLFQLGPVFFLAMPYIVWASVHTYRSQATGWLVATVYSWYFLLLSVLQIRFIGQLALFMAIFAGLGFVHLAAWVDLARYPAPFAETGESPSRILDGGAESGEGMGPTDGDPVLPEEYSRRQVLSTASLGLGVGGIGAVLTPLKHSQVTISNSLYRTGLAMRRYADRRGWDYPDNYVFSRWSRNRTLNYLVNGESFSYTFARRNFDDFLLSTDGGAWYRRLESLDRAGFVVVSSDIELPDSEGERLYTDLVDRWGERTGHYRAIWADDTASQKVYTLVPGATLTGRADPSGTESMAIDIDAGGETRQVNRPVVVNEFGVYETKIPYPGEYELGGLPVSISRADVETGGFAQTFDGPGLHHWSFNEGSGTKAHDYWGGHHGSASEANWTTTDGGTAFVFDEADTMTVRPVGFDTGEAWTTVLKVTPTGRTATQALFSDGGNQRGDNVLLMVHDSEFAVFQDRRGELTYFTLSEPFKQRTIHLAVTVTTGGVMRLYEDGTLTATREPASTAINVTTIGGAGVDYQFEGLFHDLRVYDSALSASEVVNLVDRASQS